MADLPKDIFNQLKKDFQNDQDFKEVEMMLHGVQEDDRLNVGSAQLIRSILIIAKGDKAKIREIIESTYYGDPRDVIMMGMGVSDNQSNYGIDPFE